jgi:hypothetical protein
VAAGTGDELLAVEGALRAFNLLMPVLAAQRDVSPLLYKPLLDLHATLTALKATTPSGGAGASALLPVARVTAAVSVWLLLLLHPVHPDLASGAAAVAAGSVIGLSMQPSPSIALDCALLKLLQGGGQAAPPDSSSSAAGPATTAKLATKGAKKQPKQQQAGADTQPGAACSTAGRPQIPPEQLQELHALQEELLRHPKGAALAAGLHASRSRDPSDLAAAVLPKLSQPHALSNCWPLLATPGAQGSDRWLPLCMLAMQAGAQQHGAALLLAMPPAACSSAAGVCLEAAAAAGAGVIITPELSAAAAAAAALLLAVKQRVRLAARQPQLLAPKWSVAAAAAELEALGDQGPAPSLPQPQLPADATPADKAAAVAAWEMQNVVGGQGEGGRGSLAFVRVRRAWHACAWRLSAADVWCCLVTCRRPGGWPLPCCCSSGCLCC